MTERDNGNTQFMPLDELIAHLDGLVNAFEDHPDEATREAVFSLLQGIDALHRGAFNRLAAFLEDRQAAHLLSEAAQVDRLIKTVFNLYDVLPNDEAVVQVEGALARVRPYIESHGGWLKLLTVEGGLVHLEMGGACNGCAGSTFTLQRGVRKALQEEFSGFEEIVVHHPAETARTTPGGFISLDDVYTPPSMLQAPIFSTVAALEDLPPGSLKQVRLLDIQALVANVDGDIYAVADFCPGSMLPLSSSKLEGATLTCPWHREQYDVRSGHCLDPAGRHDNPRLPVYPVAVRNGEIQIAINVSARPPLMEAQRA